VVSFGRSLRDPGVDRARLREEGSARSPPAFFGFNRNSPAFYPFFGKVKPSALRARRRR
jgi:hypothetical protein